MGFYESNDGWFSICTLECPPLILLTPKGRHDTKYAIKIQRWWRKFKNEKINCEQKE